MLTRSEPFSKQIEHMLHIANVLLPPKHDPLAHFQIPQREHIKPQRLFPVSLT